ncbi:CheR family methyltransferase [Aerolutibacter ruishenii]|uniref:Chemotaxis protein methyltransferase n=1 Tax=Aerolutibacter ruishenii TaxID=686800 RepID=A0A562LK41_9GAMM|nr:protein-glutamate O-methyltransferase CheR [Lysobacter ruishenii]TWI07988.1 chemotaxis protein methyltransferase CheR [Lysobacter ruishenii]
MNGHASFRQGVAEAVPLSDSAFRLFQDMLLQSAGISLASGKKAMVAGRLAKRLKHLQLDSYEAYHQAVARSPEEMQVAVDLLTTNETHFFREQPHFDLLRERILPSLSKARPLRIWSAAASTGQEAYSLAMLLARHVAHNDWEVFGSDISSRVLEQARRGQYDMSQARELPDGYLRAYCLRGIGRQEGSFVIAPELRQKVRFSQINLNASLPDIGLFDVVLLRNVLIYFQPDVKQRVIGHVLERLRPGGWLLVGHSESFGSTSRGLVNVVPSVYRKP